MKFIGRRSIGDLLICHLDGHIQWRHLVCAHQARRVNSCAHGPLLTCTVKSRSHVALIGKGKWLGAAARISVSSDVCNVCLSIAII